MYKIRGICELKNCKNKQAKKGTYKGSPTYRKTCEMHRKKHKISEFAFEFKKKKCIPNKKCSHCDWSKAPCDRHRKVPIKGYIKSNIIILCPNCHRLKHLKLI